MGNEVAPASALTDPVAYLAALLGAAKSPHVRRAVMAYAAARIVISGTAKYRDKLKAASRYAVSVNGEDALYPVVARWLTTKLPPDRRRTLTVRTGKWVNPSDEVLPVDVSPSARARSVAPIEALYDGHSPLDVDLDGHTVRVETIKPEWNGSMSEAAIRRAMATTRIEFTCHSVEARDAVLAHLQGLADAQGRRNPRLYMATPWGSWDYRSEGAYRPLESVILEAGQRERIVADVERFLTLEPEYRRLGIPYHRGYLFEGSPGSGKTSLGRALASEFDLDVYYLPLSAIEQDTSLIQLLGHVTERSILLMEDVDVVHGARDRDDTQGGVSLSGLLNALDGFVTPHGAIMIMTTNDVAALDPALIRPGRVDLLEHFGDVTVEQFDRIRSTFGYPVEWPGPGHTAADIVGDIKRLLDLQAVPQ